MEADALHDLTAAYALDALDPAARLHGRRVHIPVHGDRFYLRDRAHQALRAVGRTMLVMSCNGVLEAVQQVAAGNLLATVDFSTFKMACLATEAALRHLAGQPVPEKIMLPTEIIGRTNHEAWLVPVAERPCPTWDQYLATTTSELNR